MGDTLLSFRILYDRSFQCCRALPIGKARMPAATSSFDRVRGRAVQLTCFPKNYVSHSFGVASPALRLDHDQDHRYRKSEGRSGENHDGS
jgi:hypothetical protein